MTRVDFYVLGEAGEADRYRFACRLVEKIYQQNRRAYIHTGSEEEARQLDRLLWTYRQDSFLPHGLHGKVNALLNPILIGWGEDPGSENDVLINLAPEIPMFFSRFERVSEIVDTDPQVRELGRQRYRFYRDRGYPLESHQIEPSTRGERR